MTWKDRASLRALTAALIGGIATASCASSHANLPVARVPYQDASGRIVAAMGLTEDDVRASIQAALKAGAVPRYVEIKANGHGHVFAPTAEVVRTKRALVVKTAFNVYLWDLSNAHVYYSGSSEEVDINAIPFTASAMLDGYIRPHGVAYPAMSADGQHICADCSMLFGPPKGSARTDSWKGLADPWQAHPDYTVPSAPSGSQRTLDGYTVCEWDVNGEHCWYYGDANPNQYYTSDPYYGSGTGGGSGVITTQIPCIPVNASNDLVDAINGNDFAKALAQAVAVNFGGRATSINSTAINDATPGGGDIDAKAHYQTNTIDWDPARVAAATGGDQNALLQIFIHEALHLWYETLNADGTGRPNPFPGEAGFQGTRTVTLAGGTILTFTIGADANHVLSAGYTGFEHIMIHNVLVGEFNTDRTGALAEAFLSADTVQIPGQVAQKFTDFNAAKNAITAHNLQNMPAQSGLAPRVWPPMTPNYGGGCSSVSARARNPLSARHMKDYAEVVDGYTVIWDGASIM